MLRTTFSRTLRWLLLAASVPSTPAAGQVSGPHAEQAVEVRVGTPSVPRTDPASRRRRAEAGVVDQLGRRGFENVRARELGDTLLVSFEYRMGRGSHAGVCEALGAASGAHEHVVLVLEHQEVPMAALVFEASATGHDTLRGTGRGSGHDARAACGSVAAGARATDSKRYHLTAATQHVEPYVERLRDGRHARSRYIDVTLHPRYSAAFGFYRDPIMLQLNAAPRLNVRLWTGFEIGAQTVIPFYNEFSNEGDYVRPGLLTASQFLRLPGATFLRATAGTFTNRRFGLDVRVRRFFQGGRYWAGFEMGRTGNVFYPNGSVFVEQDPEWIVLATAGLGWAEHNTYVDAAFGRFLFGDLGARIEMSRQFRRTDVGFVFAQTVNGANAGLRIVLPLFRGLFAGSRSLRVRPAPEFAWDYMYRAGTNVGESYDTGYFMDRVYRQYQPDYLTDLLSAPQP